MSPAGAALAVAGKTGFGIFYGRVGDLATLKSLQVVEDARWAVQGRHDFGCFGLAWEATPASLGPAADYAEEVVRSIRDETRRGTP